MRSSSSSAGSVSGPTCRICRAARATGATLDEVEASIRLAIQYHILGLKGDGAQVPLPMSRVNYVAVSA